ncbi:MAG TPA: MFS transporter [Pseudonocardiaceae bacterium]
MTDGNGTRATAPGHEQGVRTPAFRRLWWSWTVSLLGDGVRTLALPLYVAVTTRSPLAASAVTAAEVLPWLLCALPAGALVDRSNPRTVVTIAHTVRAVLTGVLVVCIVTGNATVPVLCAFAFTLTVAETFAYSASQALMVALAGPDQLNEANAKFYTVHTIGLNLVGPLTAGGLFVIGPAWAFALDGLTFVVAAVLVARLPSISRARSESAPRRRLGPEIREGISLLFRIPGLRVLVLMVATITLSLSAVNALTSLYALQTLRMTESLVATLLVAGALGTLLGTRLATVLARRWPEGPVMTGALVAMVAGLATFGAVPEVWVALGANALLGVGVGVFNVLAAARRQRLTPTTAMGRISGAYRMVAWGLAPVGAALAGPVAVVTSLGAVFVIVGGVILVMTAFVLRPLVATRPAVPAQRDGLSRDIPAGPTEDVRTPGNPVTPAPDPTPSSSNRPPATT